MCATNGIYEEFASDGTRHGEQRFLDLASRPSTIWDPADYLTSVLTEVQHHDHGRHSDDTPLHYIA